jgi:hypothetical protein
VSKEAGAHWCCRRWSAFGRLAVLRGRGVIDALRFVCCAAASPVTQALDADTVVSAGPSTDEVTACRNAPEHV